ncbi:MAG: iron-containing alcohol dehydrogenase [Treponemataceae bacterium]
MLNFEYHSSTQFFFGTECEQKLPALLQEYKASKVLLHYGKNSVQKSGLLKEVETLLDSSKIPYEKLGGVEPNPKSSLVYEGIALCKEKNIDTILAIGGGSVIDSAKAISLGAADSNNTDFWDFFIGKAIPKKHLTLGVILTIPASGSEGSTSCVITHEKDNLKRGFNHQLNRPAFALLNPKQCYTLPSYQTACGIVDILSHVLERYMSQEKGVTLSDRLCEALMLAVIENAHIVMQNPSDYNAQANIMWAGTLAHNHLVGLGREGDWSTHPIEHELSALYNVAHGAGLAVILPAYMYYQYKHNVPLFAQFANRIFGIPYNRDNQENTAIQGINALKSFFEILGMPITMEQLGAKKEDIPYLANKVKVNPQGYNGNFHPLNKDDFEKIYLSAFEN